jgi:hypothetical protein
MCFLPTRYDNLSHPLLSLSTARPLRSDLIATFYYVHHIYRLLAFLLMKRSNPTTAPPRIDPIIPLSSIRTNRSPLFRSLTPHHHCSPFEAYEEGATGYERN